MFWGVWGGCRPAAPPWVVGLLCTNICLALEGLIFRDSQQISETGTERGRRNFVTLTCPFLELVVRRSLISKKKNNALRGDHVSVSVMHY
jgi:hypothetical protein